MAEKIAGKMPALPTANPGAGTGDERSDRQALCGEARKNVTMCCGIQIGFAK
jgi:hypothetical protein